MARLVYNPGRTVVVYDDAKMVAPGEWAYVEGKHVEHFLEIGKLVAQDVPTQMPEHVATAALVPLQDAINDKNAQAQSQQKGEKEPVRNTDPKKTTSKADKEA